MVIGEVNAKGNDGLAPIQGGGGGQKYSYTI